MLYCLLWMNCLIPFCFVLVKRGLVFSVFFLLIYVKGKLICSLYQYITTNLDSIYPHVIILELKFYTAANNVTFPVECVLSSNSFRF